MEDNCRAEAFEFEIREVLGNGETFRKYQRFALNQAVSTLKGLHWCPTPGCDFAFSYDENEEGKISTFRCL